MRNTCNIILKIFLACELPRTFKRLILFIAIEGFEMVCKNGSLPEFHFFGRTSHIYSLVM